MGAYLIWRRERDYSRYALALRAGLRPFSAASRLLRRTNQYIYRGFESNIDK
jgi:hypothetical protein